jgi:putative inorganic carbon (HCO3(-)) transporter
LYEHGFLALFVWLRLIDGTLFSLTSLLRLGKHHAELPWFVDCALAIRLSLLVYLVGTLTLGLSYWSVLYQLIFSAVLPKKFALQELASISLKVTTGRPSMRQPGIPAIGRR